MPSSAHLTQTTDPCSSHNTFHIF